MNPKVDFYFNKTNRWLDEIAQLRSIALECGLTEELKWGCPSYTFEKRNIVLIHVFKEYCAFLFFKGALLKDPIGILIQQTKNVQSARQIRFTDTKQIIEMKASLRSYILEAIQIEKAGLKVQVKQTSEYLLPDELKLKLDENKSFKKAFEALTPGRQRAYILYFSAPKQAKTRESRIEKCFQLILDGKRPNDL